MDLCGTLTMALWDGVMGLMQRPSTNTTVISGVLDQRNKKMSVIQETLPSQK